eukprot:2998318-Rhodomonas_salina.1
MSGTDISRGAIVLCALDALSGTDVVCARDITIARTPLSHTHTPRTRGSGNVLSVRLLGDV